MEVDNVSCLNSIVVQQTNSLKGPCWSPRYEDMWDTARSRFTLCDWRTGWAKTIPGCIPSSNAWNTRARFWIAGTALKCLDKTKQIISESLFVIYRALYLGYNEGILHLEIFITFYYCRSIVIWCIISFDFNKEKGFNSNVCFL